MFSTFACSSVGRQQWRCSFIRVKTMQKERVIARVVAQQLAASALRLAREQTLGGQHYAIASRRIRELYLCVESHRLAGRPLEDLLSRSRQERRQNWAWWLSDRENEFSECPHKNLNPFATSWRRLGARRPNDDCGRRKVTPSRWRRCKKQLKTKLTH